MTGMQAQAPLVEIVQGDIAAQGDVEAVVNAANAQLLPGGGVAGAIHRAAGPGLAKECRPLAPIRPGQAVLTSGHNLPNRYCIHCLGPVYGQDHPEEKLLADCYRNALKLCEEQKIQSVASPALSCGAFGYPLEAGARVALQTIKDELPRLRATRRIRFVLFTEREYRTFQRIHEELFGG